MHHDGHAGRLTVAALALSSLMGGGRAVYESLLTGRLQSADLLTALAYAGLALLLLQQRRRAGLIVSLTLCAGWLLVNTSPAVAPIAIWRGWSLGYGGIPLLSLVAAALICGPWLQRRGE